MTAITDVQNICCASLELSKSSWVCAFLVPGDERASVHKLAARDIDGLVERLETLRQGAERRLDKPLSITLCHEAGYDGFWIARSLTKRGLPTIVFDPASFLRPRRGRLAKTDRLDAEDMCRTLRTWLSGDRSVASAVRIQSVEEEDAKRIVRERKYLVQQRSRIVSRIKGLLSLHGVHLPAKGIGKKLAGRLSTIKTAEGRNLPKFARRDIERMLRCHELVSDQIAEVDADRTAAVQSEDTFPHAEKVRIPTYPDSHSDGIRTLIPEYPDTAAASSLSLVL